MSKQKPPDWAHEGVDDDGRPISRNQRWVLRARQDEVMDVLSKGQRVVVESKGYEDWLTGLSYMAARGLVAKIRARAEAQKQLEDHLRKVL